MTVARLRSFSTARPALGRRAATVSVPAWWSWAAGVLLGLCTWQVTSLYPDEMPGLFVVGLHLAADEGLRYGHDVIFTYGPLAFLTFPVLVTTWTTAAAFAFVAVLHIAFATVALRIALRSSPWPLAVVVAAVASALPVPPADQVVLLVLAGCVWLLGHDRGWYGPALVGAGGALAAFELLVKFNDGLLALVLLALAVWRLRPGVLRGEATLVGSFAVSAVAFWVASGNRLADLPTWLRLSGHLVVSYSQGMQRGAGVPGELGRALLLLACLLALTIRQAARFRDRGRGIALVLVVAAFSFAYFKEGFVRYDAAHTTVFFATVAAATLLVAWRSALLTLGALAVAAVATAALGSDARALADLLLLALVPFAAWTWPRREWPRERRLLAGVVAVAVGLALLAVSGRGLPPLQPALGDFASQARTLIDSSRREATLAGYRASWRSQYGLAPSLVARLRGRSVDVEPWGAPLAWAYGLEWRPEPLLESYAAYDGALDRYAAEAVARRGAAFILRQDPPTAIDGQNPLWEAPGLVLSQICNYRQTAVESGFAVLAREPGRCGTTHALGTATVHPGEWLAIPQVGGRELVYARMHLPRALGATFRSLLYRPDPVTVELSSGASFTLVPAVAGEPLVLRLPSGSTPVARLRLRGVAGPVRVRFYALPLR